jgi:hypothetical protein
MGLFFLKTSQKKGATIYASRSKVKEAKKGVNTFHDSA